MANQLVECVPNFSEGRDPVKIKAITDAMASVAAVRVRDVDAGPDTHRTVVTLVGPPEAVVEAAFRGIARAAELIDMRQHRGAHPRIGATDVCPFVPVEGVTMQQCVELARQLGERVGRELGIPVYLYEAAASQPQRRNLAVIRKGEYEGLAAKLADPQWQPDFGPASFDPQRGATVIGARPFLIAYNISLNTRDKALATDIAFELREKGRVARSGNPTAVYSRGAVLTYAEGDFPCGNCGFRGQDGEALAVHCSDAHGYVLSHLLVQNDAGPLPQVGGKVYRHGLFRQCKAIGWYVDVFKRAQISINLTDFDVTPPHLVLEAARRLAAERGLVVTGSEIVGLVPYRALLEAGRWYLSAQGRSPHVPAVDVLETAIQSMGLRDVTPFDPDSKVLGLPQDRPDALVAMRVRDLADEVSRDTPAPGGGSIAALVAALGAALASMVANLTQPKADTADQQSEALAIAASAQALKDALLAAVDADSGAFNAYLQARRMPASNDAERAARDQAMLQGLKQAVQVPLQTAESSLAVMGLAARAVASGLPASVTDAAVALGCGYAGVRGGVWNVLVNLKDIRDEPYVADMRARCAALTAEAASLRERVEATVDARLGGG